MVLILLKVFGVISLITFFAYGIDKLKAKLGAWRIPEKTLICLSLCGGGLGGALGMLVFRHKTRHWYFVFVNVVGVVIQIGATLALWILLRR